MTIITLRADTFDHANAMHVFDRAVTVGQAQDRENPAASGFELDP